MNSVVGPSYKVVFAEKSTCGSRVGFGKRKHVGLGKKKKIR